MPSKCPGGFFLLTLAVAMTLTAVFSLDKMPNSGAQNVYYSTSTTTLWTTIQSARTVTIFQIYSDPSGNKLLLVQGGGATSTGFNTADFELTVTNLDDDRLVNAILAIRIRYKDGTLSPAIEINVGDFEPHETKTMKKTVEVTNFQNAKEWFQVSWVAGRVVLNVITTQVAETRIYTYTSQPSAGFPGLGTSFLTVIVIVGIIVVGFAVAKRQRRPPTPQPVGPATEPQALETKGHEGTLVHCIHCGAELPEIAKFCRKCGRPQED